jgi:hypothetical protein
MLYSRAFTNTFKKFLDFNQPCQKSQISRALERCNDNSRIFQSQSSLVPKNKQKEGICISSNFTGTSSSLKTESDYPLSVSKTARRNIADNQKRERPTAPTFKDAVEFVQFQINHWYSVWASPKSP